MKKKETRNIQFKIMLNSEEKEEVERMCKELNMTKSEFIRELIKEYKNNK